jgi:hypothetical protein
MNSFHEKLLFGITTLASTGFSMLGAIMTDGEARWLYVTLAASSMTSGFLALMFKKQDEAIRLVVGRSSADAQSSAVFLPPGQSSTSWVS